MSINSTRQYEYKIPKDFSSSKRIPEILSKHRIKYSTKKEGGYVIIKFWTTLQEAMHVNSEIMEPSKYAS